MKRRKYSIIATLEVRHDYYSGPAVKGLRWMPSPQTQGWMQAQGLLCRAQGSRLYILAPLGEDLRPLRPWKGISSWVFYLLIDHPSFALITPLRGWGDQRRYYFSSWTGLEKEGETYLHPLPGPYAADRDYELGDQVVQDQMVYEARQAMKAPAPVPGDSSDHWRSMGGEPRVGEDSLVPFAGARHPLPLEPTEEEASLSWQVFYPDPLTGQGNIPALPPQVLDLDIPAEEQFLDLSRVRPGICRLEVQGQSFWLYRVGSSLPRSLLGLVELPFSGHQDPDQDLMDGEGTVRRRNFVLHFGSRSAHWLYQTRSGQVSAVKEKEDRIQFESLPGNRYLSLLPVPMVERPPWEIHLESTLLGQVGPLRIPSPPSLFYFEKEGKRIPCIQQHLAY